MWLMSLAKKRYSTKLKQRIDNYIPHVLGAVVTCSVGIGLQLGPLALIVTWIADSICKTSLIYLTGLLFLRLSNLQPIHGRSIVSMVVPKLQTHLAPKENEKKMTGISSLET